MSKRRGRSKERKGRSKTRRRKKEYQEEKIIKRSWLGKKAVIEEILCSRRRIINRGKSGKWKGLAKTGRRGE